MESTAKDIVSILNEENSLGLVSGTDLFYARMPSTPDNCVTVFDTPGAPPILTSQKNTSNYFYPGVSIMVRKIKYAEAYNLMFSILEFLHGSSQITIGTTYYALIKAVNDPQLLHYDENDRPVIFVNFEIQRRAV